MENHDHHAQQSSPSKSRSSAATAVNLANTNAGIVVPPSPSLEPSDFTLTRRRSWGNRLRNAGRQESTTPPDPIRFELTPSPNKHVPPRRSTSNNGPVMPALEDPFYSPLEQNPSDGFEISDNWESRTGVLDSMYSNSMAGPSSASLMESHRMGTELELDDGHREDDEAHLTANMSHTGMGNLGAYSTDDPEQDGGTTPKTRRKTLHYSVSPSPLKRTETAMKTVSKSLRRMSLRVVNLANTGLEGQLRLVDDDDNGKGKRPMQGEEEEGPPRPDLRQVLPLRGRTLGFLGSESKVRLALFMFLVHPLTEPLILLLIILNAVVLTIQAFPVLVLPSSLDGQTPLPPRIHGYFHSWEDYVLFVLFNIFTVEALARICVTGFLFDPEVSIFSLFAQPPEPYTPNPASTPGMARQTSLTRNRTITQRLKGLRRTLMRPFALSNKPPPTGYPQTSFPHDPHVPSAALSNGAHYREGSMTARVADMTQRFRTTIREPSEPTYLSSIMRSETHASHPDSVALPFRLSIDHLHQKTHRNVPYLRQSWSRIDFIAIVSFWITFALATTGVERGTYHVGIFRAISVIRTARLLTITSGTTTIMHSLKTARPLITSVAYFVLFAMVLFSIIGVQAFKGSMRRTCVIDPTLGEGPHLRDGQFCGGYIDPDTFQTVGYIQLNNQTAVTSKGYICPLGQSCRELSNPKQGLESFDAIYYAALQVVIVATANGWTPLMYTMIDSEFFVSCLFFIAAVIILNFWLINLFVAVITNSFAAIRQETQKSAFGAAPLAPIDKEQDDGWAIVDGRKAAIRSNPAKTIYGYTTWIWVLLSLISLVLQATRTVEINKMHERAIHYGEIGITIAFDFEIVLRILATLPEWRTFFQHGNNWLDTVLAIGCSIIEIPVIRRSSVYPWFTILQLARFYRVILVVPRMKPLLLAVFGNMYGLSNMALFLVIVNYIAALVAVQLLRGDFGNDKSVNFGEVYNSFLAMYQVFSSENWVDVLYGAAMTEMQLGQTVVVLIFIASWMLFANFIMLQMFIAVINENFEVAEEQKKGKQASNYYSQQKARHGTVGWIRKLNPYRWVKANPETAKVVNLPSNLVLPMQKSLVQSYSISRSDSRSSSQKKSTRKYQFLKPKHYSSKSLTALQQLFAGDSKIDDIPMSTLRHHGSQESSSGPVDEEMERHLELLATLNPDVGLAEAADDEAHERRAQKADFIRDHPTYDKVFWFIGQKNPLRRLCQKIVQPARGDRIFGQAPSPIAHPIFQLLLLLTVIGGVVVEGIATPVYRRNYFARYGLTRGAWFEIAEATFGFTLFVEFLIKIIADGFVFTPNGYLRSIWNCLDFFIMSGIIVNVTTGLIFVGGLSRFTRSLKALRALRLVTLIDKMRNTFETLIISGAIRILDAAVLAILYMIPYAVWGLNIFNGKMNSCNDKGVNGLADCLNEYPNTVFGDAFAFPVPRVWDNPSPSTSFSFDSFRSSLLIMFEIVSFEGWIDVMNVASSITGPNLQPNVNASPANAIFFVIYNLLGGVVVLTLFISIIIGNFSSKTGTALLTKAQREWIDLQKLFKRQRPSKRPTERPRTSFRRWCFDRAVHKHGWWSRVMTLLFVLHILALMTQSFSTLNLAETLRNDFFLALMFIYIIDVTVRCYGLGWRSFRGNGWNLFDVVVSTGSFITTLIVRFGRSGFGIQQLQKLFLVSIAFKLVQRTNSLNMLFKTAVASLPVILSLLGLWLILFIFFAILFVEVFGLTKWGGSETPTTNYYSLGSAMVMLAFQSTGEGWNAFMHDYDLTYPRCTSNVNEAESDCGSTAWTFSLHIAWNLLSMYIFVNMFTGVVVENFSYVFQASGSGSKSISREQMRAFKKVWAEYCNQETGYMERPKFAQFFSKLSGVFEVRIYPIEYNVHNILSVCKDQTDKAESIPRLDIVKLEQIVEGINFGEVRRRKAVYSRLYHEATISHEPGLGISFTDMLTLLAHHKLIVDAEALVLHDLVARTETNKLVTDLVNLDRVRSLLKTISHRRRFLKYLEDRRRAENFDKEIPSIVVEDVLGTPPLSSRDISSAVYEEGSPASPTPAALRFSQADYSIAMDTSAGTRLQRGRRTSEYTMYSVDPKSRPTSLLDNEPQIAQTMTESSVWGELMMEVAQEETGGRGF
ncbi:Ion transport protein-domain-containing protein [Crepidotus variabilis]|uniref:Calcium-channel protein CCH1 n=1 Tax=Crepidotus variabilis TaxID=179855 RepID=A0A9P6ELD8_9AGAR|nr:Ion transport protein-domain-containing protein [Crepidotus variabilis]